MLKQLGARWSRRQFEKEAQAFLPDLYRYAFGLTQNRFDAEDLVQDAYIRALEGYPTAKLPSSSAFRAWWRRILLNCFRDRYRRRQRSPEVLFDADDAYQNIVSLMPSREPLPETRVVDSRFSAACSRAMEALPEDVRAVVVLFLLEQLSYQEIATHLQIPIGTVMSRLHRGRRMLREDLKGFRETRERGECDATGM
ncbi:MAG: sigma-70 family RNA polymerase sigma factor [Gammaproteobacteria bacterium]|nr:sigma-70 family RNA polymerase sigma factor [Gammaproteobacteria bacterium]